jgi:hypothetical protein
LTGIIPGQGMAVKQIPPVVNWYVSNRHTTDGMDIFAYLLLNYLCKCDKIRATTGEVRK